MAQARSRDAWQHTSAVLCLIANVNRNPKNQPRPFRPDQFNPHMQRKRASNVSREKFIDAIVAEGRRRG